MSNYQLQITLLSDAAVGRGDGVAGLVNTEVQHDAYGCPYLGGRTLKGLLREECVNLLYLLDKMDKVGPWEAAAMRLFGEPGSTLVESAALYVSDATLAEDCTPLSSTKWLRPSYSLVRRYSIPLRQSAIKLRSMP